MPRHIITHLLKPKDKEKFFKAAREKWNKSLWGNNNLNDHGHHIRNHEDQKIKEQHIQNAERRELSLQNSILTKNIFQE